MLLAIVFILLWVLLIALTILMWSKKQIEAGTDELACSVIVPFRNEEANLTPLIHSLEAQSLSEFEVIFVNDHSTDQSLEVLNASLESSNLDYQIFSLEEGAGKKAALTLGINRANHPIVITTDADCVMGTDWLASMIQGFEKHQVNMVAGPVHLTGEKAIQRYQSLELSALMGVTAASIQLKKPTMANGANLAFRTSIFEELNGYQGIDQIPSGDDELLMHKVQTEYPGSIAFNKDVAALVTTEAKATFSDMLSQKRRWASKWKVNKRWSTILLALFVLAVNLSQFALIYEILTVSAHYQLSLWAILLKCLAEILLIAQVRSDLKVDTRFYDYFVAFLFYPIYAIYIGVAANFGSYQWKGRRYS